MRPIFNGGFMLNKVFIYDITILPCVVVESPLITTVNISNKDNKKINQNNSNDSKKNNIENNKIANIQVNVE